MFETLAVKSSEFLKRVRQIGKRAGVSVRLDTHRGKGSHSRLWYGDRWTTLKDLKKEIGPGLLAAICRQLGIDPKEL